jgi:hypothetical protein
MKTKSYLAILAAFSFLLSSRAAEPIPIASPEAAVNAPEFKNLSDLKWDKILPDLGAHSPEISILHVDPKTHATSLLIRTPKAIHVRKHWHTVESHTLAGTALLIKRFELARADSTSCPQKWSMKHVAHNSLPSSRSTRGHQLGKATDRR